MRGAIAKLEKIYYEENVNKIKYIEDSNRKLSCFIQYDKMFQFASICDIVGNLIDTNFTYLSEASMDLDKVVGKPFWETYWFNWDNKIINDLKNAIQKASNGEFVRYRTQNKVITRNESGIVDIDLTLNPLYNSNNEVVFILIEGRDITEQVQLEKDIIDAKMSAENASRAKTIFLASMTHELRTPLNGMKCILDIIKSESIDDKLKKNIDIIYSSTKHLSQIINTILDLGSLCTVHYVLYVEGYG